MAKLRAGFLVLGVVVLTGCNAEQPSGVRKVTTVAALDAVLKENEVVLVDFYADWCGPCQTMKPVVRELAKKYSGKVAVVEVDTDNAPDVATRYSVNSLPTFLVFRGGRVVDVARGAVGRGPLDASLRKALGE